MSRLMSEGAHVAICVPSCVGSEEQLQPCREVVHAARGGHQGRLCLRELHRRRCDACRRPWYRCGDRCALKHAMCAEHGDTWPASLPWPCSLHVYNVLSCPLEVYCSCDIFCSGLMCAPASRNNVVKHWVHPPARHRHPNRAEQRLYCNESLSEYVKSTPR